MDGGYYADPESECQAFHICADNGQGGLTKYSFLCPNGTLFQQQYFVCDWWFNVDCSLAESLYGRNLEVAEARKAASLGVGFALNQEAPGSQFNEVALSAQGNQRAGGNNRNQAQQGNQNRGNQNRNQGSQIIVQTQNGRQTQEGKQKGNNASSLRNKSGSSKGPSGSRQTQVASASGSQQSFSSASAGNRGNQAASRGSQGSSRRNQAIGGYVSNQGENGGNQGSFGGNQGGLGGSQISVLGIQGGFGSSQGVYGGNQGGFGGIQNGVSIGNQGTFGGNQFDIGVEQAVAGYGAPVGANVNSGTSFNSFNAEFESLGTYARNTRDLEIEPETVKDETPRDEIESFEEEQVE